MSLPELRPTDRCECGLIVAYGEIFHRNSRAHKRAMEEKLRNCPSCHGTKNAVVRAGGITFAGGLCMCQPGGTVWASSEPRPRT